MFSRQGLVTLSLAWCLVLSASAVSLAQNEGQEDLDKATQLKVAAESLDDLSEVIDRLETSLEKGLDADNTKFAQQLLVSSLLQRGTLFTAAVFNAPAEGGAQGGMRALQLRQFALNDLQRAVQLDDKLWEGHLLIGKLQIQADANAARRAFTKVLNSDETTPDQKAEAVALRSAVQKEVEDQTKDLNRAVELEPDMPDYVRLRAQHLASINKLDDALTDIDHALKIDPDHAASHELRGMILLQQEKYDDALAAFDKASELAPDAVLPYQHRGELYLRKGHSEKALEQLTKALEKAPDNIQGLLLRAGIYYALKQPDKALEDIDKAISVQPGLVRPYLMRAEILAATDRTAEAIAGLEKLLQIAPGQLEILGQLGTLYMIDNQPRKAIDVLTKVLAQDADNFRALRFRADAYLNLGQHAEAIADFDLALKQNVEDEGLLNNLAWVLATSTDDKVRDGKRAVELATKAADMSNYETPHVLSTLAAAYAETGDFETAKKWSAKAIEQSQKEIDAAESDKVREQLKADHPQLEKELASYKEGKPIRERQTGEETKKPESAEPADHAATPSAAQAPARTADF